MADTYTFEALLAERRRTAPHTPWLIDGDTALDVRAAEEYIDRWADELSAAYAPGDRVVISLPNGIAAAVAPLALARAGLVWVGAHPRVSSDAFDDICRRVGATGAITDERHLAGTGCSAGATAGGGRADGGRADRATADGGHQGSSVGRGSSRRSDELVAISFTSGTSGSPKGVMHSQHTICVAALAARDRGMDSPVIGMYLALTSINMVVLGPLQALVTGGACVCLATTDSAAVAEAVERHRITVMPMAAPTAYDWVHGGASAAQVATLVEPVVGGSSTPEEVLAAYQRRFGRRLTLGYGLTEVPTSVTREHAGSPRCVGSSGRALGHLRVTVRDDADRELPVGAVGEICVEAADDRWRPMLGYWDDPDGSARALRGGRLHSGDRGRLDAEGNLFVIGRGEDMIVRGGVNIDVEHLERVLRGAPGVVDAAVIGIDDDRLGQVPVAAVALAVDAARGLAAVEEWCLRHLSAAERLAEIRVVDSLPRTPGGKLRRASLRELMSWGLSRRRGPS